MKPYIVSLAVGLLVGIIYALLKVRSPAPPVIALVGLLGILIGEQIVPLAKRLLAGQPVSVSEVKAECSQQMFGRLPQHATPPPQREPADTDKLS
jgi:XapX domain-containing protein